MESLIEFLSTMHWGAVFQIILIDILLGGDNAVVIALACRNLPNHLKMRGILWGTAGAIILRVILIAFAVFLLQVPFLQVVGGLLLVWIGIKLLVPDEDHHANIDGGTGLISAIRTIIVADLVMSVDNVIAIAAAASALRARSAGVSTTCAPSTASALDRVRFHTVTSKPAAAKTIQQLRSFASISDIVVGQITETPDESGNRLVSFSVDCKYNAEPAEPAEKTGALASGQG